MTEEIELVPTKNRELIASLLGKRITKFTRRSETEPAELLASVPFSGRRVTAPRVFAMADGPAVLELGGPAIAIGHASSVASVIIEVADRDELDEDWPVVIEAQDPAFSEPVYAAAIGRTVVGARVVQGEFSDQPTLEGMSVRRMSPGMRDLPREVMLVLVLDDLSELRFVTLLVDAPNDFAVLTTADKLDMSGCREILRVP
jgi:hypothetical protein